MLTKEFYSKITTLEIICHHIESKLLFDENN